jgi:suppressor for copper-sensitivity B
MVNWIRSRPSRAPRIAALAAMLLVALGAGSARAAAETAASSWFETDQGKVRLIAAQAATGGEATARLGLEFRLAEGWKVYWRSPGDAGLPPTIDWAGSTNLAAADIAWPAPQRFSAYGLETIGYEGAVVLPITAHLAKAGEGLSLRAALQYLTCKDICIPYDTVLTLGLPASGAAGGTASSSGQAALIDQFARMVPGDATAGGLQLTGSALTLGKTPTLELKLTAAAAPLASLDAFVEGPAGIGFGAPHTVRGDATHATLTVPVSGDADVLKSLAGTKLRVTIVDGTRAIEAETTPKQAAAPRDAALLPAMLGIALLGGFILNFMPCVLPVLSIKLLSITAQAGRSRRAVRIAFLATALGIIASFLALAAVLMALRGGGLAVGWGMQFQQPVFLVAMTALCAALACNLAGFFEIPLPSFLTPILSAGGGRSGFLGDFSTGAVATLLATPCSAPFLGTAIGFALAGDSVDIVAIFLALGIGLALPYLAVAALPVMASLLPRPGAWMLTLRRILAALLAATALWLVSVLAAQTSLTVALAVSVALLIAALVPRLVAAPALRRAGMAAACAVAIVVPVVLPVPAASTPADGTLWQHFDAATIDRLVHDGKIVFVDVTADWCINCKVNEHLVLQSDEVQSRLSQPQIVAMRADWTRPDEAIGAFLRGFGRYGIPFYAVFGPATPDGQALPEILTGSEVLDALKKAAPDGVKSAGAPPSGRNGG